jgi:hypothetical protein
MSKRYNVLMVGQQFSPICWLACAAMVIQFKRGYTPSTAALGMRGPDFRTPGLTVPEETRTGFEWDVWLRRLGFTLVRSPAPSEATIESVLVNHGPFILSHNVGAFWYGPTRAPASGEMLMGSHSVVVTGIDTNSHTVYFNNSWGDRDVPTTVSSIVGAIRRWESSPADSAIAYL